MYQQKPKVHTFKDGRNLSVPVNVCTGMMNISAAEIAK